MSSHYNGLLVMSVMFSFDVSCNATSIIGFNDFNSMVVRKEMLAETVGIS